MLNLNTYQIDSISKIGGKDVFIFADRVITDMSQKQNDEFVFAKYKHFIFVGHSKDLIKSKKTYVGFWHTLFINNTFDKKSNDHCYLLVDKEQDGDGQYIYFNNNTMQTGTVLSGVASNIVYKTETLINLSDFTVMTKWHFFRVLTPKQCKIKSQKRTKYLILTVVVLCAFAIALGEYLLLQNTFINNKNKTLASQLSARINKINQSAKKIIISKKTNYFNAYLPNLKIIATEPVWVGRVDFYSKTSQLTTTNNFNKKHTLIKNITREGLESWLLRLP